jgi:S-adenosylmethionine hydrolase
MQIITLTSDIGQRDYYIASVKGMIYKKIPGAQIVDITHEVRPFDNLEAAYHLRSCFESFPDGTIHIMGVDAEPLLPSSTLSPYLENAISFPTIVIFKSQYFISNDNGFIGAFLGDDVPDRVYRYVPEPSQEGHLIFTMRDCFVDLALKISQKTPFTSFCTEVESYKRAFVQAPLIEKNQIQGTVIHIDAFGNIITNILKSDFERYGEKTPFIISYIKRSNDIDTLSKAYNEVPIGERLAIFNTNNRLEIAINQGANEGNGGANKLFGVRLGEIVRVTFYPAGSITTLNEMY